MAAAPVAMAAAPVAMAAAPVAMAAAPVAVVVTVLAEHDQRQHQGHHSQHRRGRSHRDA